MDISERIERLRKEMSERKIDYIFISNFENQFYYTNLKAITYSRPILFFLTHEYSALIVPTLEENHAKHHTKVDDVLIYHEVPNKNNENSFLELVKKLVTSIPHQSVIGVEQNSLNTTLYKLLIEQNLKVVDIDEVIVKERSIKSLDELALIKKSGELVSNALAESMNNLKPGLTELEMDYFGNRYLFEEVSKNYPESTLDYFVMSPSGIYRTNMPHVFSNTRKIETNDIIIHSRQVALNGYRAECERTIFTGKPTNKQIEAFKVMKEAQEAALDFIKVGVNAREVNERAVNIFKKYGYEDYIVHRTGHGIGIGVHEEPSLRFDNELILEENMVFCVEPGIYIPEVGGFRHSDTVILNENGTELVTKFTNELNGLTY